MRPERARKVREREMTSNGGKVLISLAQALRRLAPGDVVHCYRNPKPGLVIGESWPRTAVVRALREADEIHESGSEAQRSGHGIAVLAKACRDYVFFDTTGGART